MRVYPWIACVVMVLAMSCEKPGQSNEDTSEADGMSQELPVTHVVEITQMKFVPQELNIARGDTVVWINRDMVAHDVTESTRDLWRSSPMVMGKSWKSVFTTSQQYHCSLHVVMTGKIVVGGEVALLNTSPVIAICSD